MSIYACSDLHGQYDLWRQIKEYIKPEDTLYCIGDMIDRHIKGWDIVDEIREMKNVVFLRGNHEDMAAGAFKAILQNIFWSQRYSDWIRNKGDLTCPKRILDKREEMEKYMDYFEGLEIRKEIYVGKKKIILDHSGFVVTQEPAGGWYVHEPMWDRDHFFENWPVTEEYKDTYLIHGHTPTWFFDQKMKGFYSEYPLYAAGYTGKDIEKWKEYDPKIIWYADGHKVNIDMGSYFTNTAVLLNLDTFEEIYFKQEVKDDELK